MLASKNEYISGAYKHLQIISQDKQKRLEYEARQKAILDHNQFMLGAEQRGEQRAMQKIQKAEQAKLKAELEAEQAKLEAEQAKLEAEQAKLKNNSIVKKLIDAGYDTDFITTITSLNSIEIENLRKEL